MRRILLVLALLGALIPGAAAAKPRFPYVAYVGVEEAPLRSGPGDEHYPTDRLERGTKVEVHRHDPGGWYAVRPPAGSFSWVPARQVEMTDEADVGEVTKEGVVAWVGVRDGGTPNLGWQIEFKKGDLVEVLGAKRLSLAEGEPEQTCYKVAPPAGEFRWIKNKFVTRRGADELAEEPAERSPAESKVKLAGLELPIDDSKPAPSGAPELKAADPGTQGSKPVDAPPKFDGFVPRKKRSGDENETASTPATSNSPTFKPVSEPAAPQPQPVAEDGLFEARLRELDVQLSLQVAQPPGAWNLTPLRQKAAHLTDTGPTALERGRARLLLEKIDEFSEFARRQPLPGAPAEGSVSGATKSAYAETKAKGLVDTASKPIGSGVRGSEFAPDIDPRYDGIGWLMPVHAQNRSIPSYALCDRDGKVLQYVTPATGLNLNRYLRTQVGVYGQRGYVTQLHTPHLTAHKIVSLERHRK